MTNLVGNAAKYSPRPARRSRVTVRSEAATTPSSSSTTRVRACRPTTANRCSAGSTAAAATRSCARGARASAWRSWPSTPRRCPARSRVDRRTQRRRPVRRHLPDGRPPSRTHPRKERPMSRSRDQTRPDRGGCARRRGRRQRRPAAARGEQPGHRRADAREAAAGAGERRQLQRPRRVVSCRRCRASERPSGSSRRTARRTSASSTPTTSTPTPSRGSSSINANDMVTAGILLRPGKLGSTFAPPGWAQAKSQLATAAVDRPAGHETRTDDRTARATTSSSRSAGRHRRACAARSCSNRQ